MRWYANTCQYNFSHLSLIFTPKWWIRWNKFIKGILSLHTVMQHRQSPGADWPWGAPGEFRWPGSQFGPLPYIYLFFYYLFFICLNCCCFCCLLNVLKWLFPNLPFNNKTLYKSCMVSLDWQRDLPRTRSARPLKRCETREWSGSAQVEQRGKTVLFRGLIYKMLHRNHPKFDLMIIYGICVRVIHRMNVRT